MHAQILTLGYNGASSEPRAHGLVILQYQAINSNLRRLSGLCMPILILKSATQRQESPSDIVTRKCPVFCVQRHLHGHQYRSGIAKYNDYEFICCTS